MTVEMRIKQATVTETMRALSAYVASCEGRFRMSSEDMAGAVARGEQRETAEISTWLTKYRVLRGFQARRTGRTTGTSTRDTETHI